MGGMVALCMRKRGRTQTRIVPKYHTCLPTSSDFLSATPGKNSGFPVDWKVGENVSLAPSDYGLVVIDHKTRWVGSSNEYATVFEGVFNVSRDTQMKDLVELCGQNRIEQIKVYAGAGQAADMDLPDGEPVDLQTILKAAGHACKNLGIELDDNCILLADVAPPKGWTFEEFNVENPHEWEQFMRALDERGLSPTTPEDLAVWDEFFVEDKKFEVNPAAAWRASMQAKELSQSTQTPMRARLGTRRI